MEHESATPAVYWEDDDDSDDERCQPSSSMKPSALPCGGGGGEDVVALDLVYVVVWSEPYQCPIIYFTAAALPREDVGEGSKEQQRKGHGVRPFRPTVQQLKQWVMPGISDPLTSSSSIGGGDEVVSYAGPKQRLPKSLLEVARYKRHVGTLYRSYEVYRLLREPLGCSVCSVVRCCEQANDAYTPGREP
ncbi:Hypothetical protein, putative [Bodo saltans]|uniref:Uncharacterized protein n=1 Tax=Bodo saltans TaxID=75058 RepID=A0A0S4ITB2_BODSA|nr:Hypothetical protein, putative [Bodo saltans]|eukprot:CUF79729.1 Hypothetical protein, putative [Bodo saltans]